MNQTSKLSVVITSLVSALFFMAAAAQAGSPVTPMDTSSAERGSCTVTCTASATPTSGAAPLDVTFSSTATATGCTGFPTYDWDFGDGSAHSSLQNPTHTYASDGTYNWTMTASDDAQSCTKWGTITIGSTSCTLSCTASASPVSGAAPLNVTFSATATATDCSGTPSYDWDFGDGSSHSTVQNPSHTYSSAGTWNWTMTAGVDGQTCTKTGTITATSASTHSITGSVGGDTAGGVTMRLSGAADMTTTTDANGDYVFSGLANGSYTVTPFKKGFSFSPSSLDVSINDTDRTGQDFTSIALVAWAWGRNEYGELGNGTNTSASTPVQVTGFSTVAAIAGGTAHSLAVDGNGNAWAWGSNSYGQLGNGTSTNSNVPVQVSNLTGVVSVAAGRDFSLALTNGNVVWAWGYNGDGELGDGTSTNRSVPVRVSDLTGVSAVAAGETHSIALRSDGTVWAWGDNYYGELGDGTNTDSSIPVQVSKLTGAVAIAAGKEFSLAIGSDGTVWAWGNNESGQLGDGSNDNSNVPVQVTGLSGVTAIAAGAFHCLALKNDGSIWAWGHNADGELGNGTNLDSNTPVQVSSLSGATSVACGYAHSLALKGDGTSWAWGSNGYGELGDGTNTDSNVPVRVSDLTSVTEVASGADHSLAIAPGSSCMLSCTATVPSAGQTGASVSFSATATPSGCTGTPTFDWDFGDGSAHATGQSTTHTYSADGVYTWAMTVSLDGRICVKTGSISILSVAPPTVTDIKKAQRPGNPSSFKIKIYGTNFDQNVQVYIGDDTTPWPNVKWKNGEKIVLKKGRTLKKKFPKGECTAIRIVNPDGGEVTTGYERGRGGGVCNPI